jgi:HAD superfamily hydrolase (TIGR01490 family)
VALAIFDLDNTLLAGDSDHAWGQFLVDQGIVDAKVYKEANDHFYRQYQQGGLDIHEYLEFALKPLAEHSKQQLDQWHRQFMMECIEPIMLGQARELLSQHRDRGDYLLIITATNRFVTEPIARALFVDHILATDPEFVDGAYTGKVAGTPCFQDGKVTRLNEWLADHQMDLKGSYFYSDSHNDLPLLERVDNPIAVDADEILTNTAKQRGWPIMSLRD